LLLLFDPIAVLFVCKFVELLFPYSLLEEFRADAIIYPVLPNYAGGPLTPKSREVCLE
jgi:hypothetical protein